MTTRRVFLTAVGAQACAVWGVPAAQTPATVRVIGILGVATAAGYRPQIEAFRRGLRELGYIEGTHVRIEVRWADGYADRLPGLAQELVALRPDVLVTSAQGTAAAKRITSTVPIVMAVSADAVALGLVDSLARPGGNVTGSSFFLAELNAKRLELLRKAIPRARRVDILLHRGNPSSDRVLAAARSAAASLGLEVRPLAAASMAELEAALRGARRAGVDGIVVSDYPLFIAEAARVASLARDARLPAIGPTELAPAGGLLGYGVEFTALWHRAAHFVDRIFKGAKPAELPVEQPTRFEFVVNLRTARDLGIAVPDDLLLRADEVIR